jgi:hypothetical protein
MTLMVSCGFTFAIDAIASAFCCSGGVDCYLNNNQPRV